jgi:hypothetical protein
VKRSCVVLAFVLSISFAQSQPPSPGPSKPAQDQQRHEDAKGKVADRPEKTIQPGSPSAFSKTESSDHTDNKSDQSPSNWWLIIPTMMIAVATGVQAWIYCRQAHYMRRGLRISINQARIANKSAIAARDSADAALLTAKLSREILRADVYIESIELEILGKKTQEFWPNTAVSIHFKNRGQTRAIDFRANIWAGITGRDDTMAPSNMPPITIGPGDIKIWSYEPLGQTLSAELCGEITKGNIMYTLNGTFSYRDIFKTFHPVKCSANFDHMVRDFRVTQVDDVQKQNSKKEESENE